MWKSNLKDSFESGAFNYEADSENIHFASIVLYIHTLVTCLYSWLLVCEIQGLLYATIYWETRKKSELFGSSALSILVTRWRRSPRSPWSSQLVRSAGHFEASRSLQPTLSVPWEIKDQFCEILTSYTESNTGRLPICRGFSISSRCASLDRSFMS